VDHEVRHGGRVRAHVRGAVLAAAGEPDGDAGRHLLAVGDRLVGALEAGRVDEEAVRPADVRADQAVGHDLGARPRVLAAVEVDGGVRIRLEALDGPAQVVVTLFGGALRVAVRLAWQPGQGAGLQDDDGRRAADLGGDAVDPLVVLVELLGGGLLAPAARQVVDQEHGHLVLLLGGGDRAFHVGAGLGPGEAYGVGDGGQLLHQLGVPRPVLGPEFRLAAGRGLGRGVEPYIPSDPQRVARGRSGRALGRGRRDPRTGD